MEIDDMKTDWKNSSGPKKNTDELAGMTRVHEHPQFRRVRFKLLIESVLLIVLLFSYYDAFDGHLKPLWLNSIFVVAALLYVLNDVFGLVGVIRLPRDKSSVNALTSMSKRLKFLKFCSLVTSTIFGLALIAFFSIGINLNMSKLLILSGMVLTLGVFMFFANRNWNQRIRHITGSIESFRG